ncbi:hypothetical protein HK102_000402 [Quaeritorhiza haematococci]|nr:hypothetical protein HK102_000402 [Quaeritorhiza haematococci]
MADSAMNMQQQQQSGQQPSSPNHPQVTEFIRFVPFPIPISPYLFVTPHEAMPSRISQQGTSADSSQTPAAESSQQNTMPSTGAQQSQPHAHPQQPQHFTFTFTFEPAPQSQTPHAHHFPSFNPFMDLFSTFVQAAAMQQQQDISLQGQPPASKSAIETQLRKVPLTQRKIQRQPNCGICLEDFVAGSEDTATEMPCKHIFHEECLLTWLKQSNTCPHCRYEIETDNVDYNKVVAERMRGRVVPNDDEDEQQGRGKAAAVSCALQTIGCCGKESDALASESSSSEAFVELQTCRHRYHSGCLASSLAIAGYDLPSAAARGEKSMDIRCPMCRKPNTISLPLCPPPQPVQPSKTPVDDAHVVPLQTSRASDSSAMEVDDQAAEVTATTAHKGASEIRQSRSLSGESGREHARMEAMDCDMDMTVPDMC